MGRGSFQPLFPMGIFSLNRCCRLSISSSALATSNTISSSKSAPQSQGAGGRGAIISATMFRLLGGLAVKSFPRVCLPVFSSNTSRRAYAPQASYTGPPSYEMMSPLFSSQAPPQGYFRRVRAGTSIWWRIY